MKINQMPEFYTILARKIIKIPEFLYLPEKLTFYTIFDRKMPEFYIIIARKVFSLLFFGGGHVTPRLLRLCFCPMKFVESHIYFMPQLLLSNCQIW